MTVAATLTEALAPLRADPKRAAVLLDIDGTLAPIVRHAADAHVPESTRTPLIAVSRRYGLVACVSGRRASDARRIVSIGSIAYLGSHGSELLAPGGVEPVLDEQLSTWTERVAEFARESETEALRRLRIRIENKGAIFAYHWRGAPDEQAAGEALRSVADAAERDGLRTHWGRKVLEVRPPVQVDKGAGIARLLADSDVATALYAGDDLTDLDAFRSLRTMVDDGRLTAAVLVGVRSDEGPEEIQLEADIVVEGPEGVRGLLAALLVD